jgi:hypothetical protein
MEQIKTPLHCFCCAVKVAHVKPQTHFGDVRVPFERRFTQSEVQIPLGARYACVCAVERSVRVWRDRNKRTLQC